MIMGMIANHCVRPQLMKIQFSYLASPICPSCESKRYMHKPLSAKNPICIAQPVRHPIGSEPRGSFGGNGGGGGSAGGGIEGGLVLMGGLMGQHHRPIGRPQNERQRTRNG